MLKKIGFLTGCLAALALTRTAAHAQKPATDSVRALYRYQRDDKTPDKRTLVRIDAGHRAVAAIDPNVFGNFIEHLGGSIYSALWAQTLLNPNLESVEDGEAGLPEWNLIGTATWQMEGYRSPRSVRLVAASEGGNHAPGLLSPGSLTQTVYLPVHRTRGYTLAFAARAPMGKAKLRASLARQSGAAGVALTENSKTTAFPQTDLTVTAKDWRVFRLHWTVPAGLLAKGEAAVFQLTYLSGPAIDVDQVELTPDDNREGVDADVLQRAEAEKIPVLRWPGGNFASGYDWRDGIGPRADRPTRRNVAWGGVEPNHFGVDEFLKFSREVGAQPQLTVNAGDGTPENAAAWVRYCNGKANADDMAKLRQANGNPGPYNVRLWEVGNELYGGWQIGHTDAKGNAARFVRFRDAMLQADPNLRLIATGKGDEFVGDGLQRNRDWNARVLQAALANGGQAPDYLSIHPLVALPGGLGGATYAEQYESAMAVPTYLGDTVLPDLARLISDIEGPNARTKIAPTEWGIIIGGDKWQSGPNHDVLAGAIFNALQLNALMRNADWVTLANMTALLHGGGIKKPDGVVIVDPQYWTQTLYAEARPRTPIETMTVGPGGDVPQRGGLPAVANVPDVDVLAALSEGDKKLVIFAVNHHRTEARPLQVEVAGFAARSVAGTALSASDPQTRNTIQQPDAARPQPFPLPAWPSARRAPWQITLPPHTLIVLTLER